MKYNLPHDEEKKQQTVIQCLVFTTDLCGQDLAIHVKSSVLVRDLNKHMIDREHLKDDTSMADSMIGNVPNH